ncbi:hypothetical protein PAPYR_9698 [Paratrimastix pyriformis]|uniref:Uncharacterized protein n=1 Tax=Paratrimastix pyriformis TaxID=342808 RepID=A0ABQ8UDA7_9EUKA|nr:hypothetical protein PAPYR_9698 [Paratrimastix pyriformis]
MQFFVVVELLVQNCTSNGFPPFEEMTSFISGYTALMAQPTSLLPLSPRLSVFEVNTTLVVGHSLSLIDGIAVLCPAPAFTANCSMYTVDSVFNTTLVSTTARYQHARHLPDDLAILVNEHEDFYSVVMFQTASGETAIALNAWIPIFHPETRQRSPAPPLGSFVHPLYGEYAVFSMRYVIGKDRALDILYGAPTLLFGKWRGTISGLIGRSSERRCSSFCSPPGPRTPCWTPSESSSVGTCVEGG